MFTSRRPLIVCKLLSNTLQPNCASKITTSTPALVNYYDELGISSTSTQTDIKVAYYELSKVYHPDKNKGCEVAAKRFRAISEAYEVLGNYRLRRLYDKGAFHKTASHTVQTDVRSKVAEDVEDDPQTKFYKSRFTKSKVVDYTGRTPIYNFDEWAKAHYGKSFERRKTAKSKNDDAIVKKQRRKISFQTEVILLCAAVGILAIYAGITKSSHDIPKETKKDLPVD